MRYCETRLKTDESALLQHESLRSHVLKKNEIFSTPTLGLTLFIRQGMLAWIETCHQCIPVANPTLHKQPESPDLPCETKSEMIKVMANMTLFNLKETHS